MGKIYRESCKKLLETMKTEQSLLCWFHVSTRKLPLSHHRSLFIGCLLQAYECPKPTKVGKKKKSDEFILMLSVIILYFWEYCLFYQALHTKYYKDNNSNTVTIWLIKTLPKTCTCSLHFPYLLLKLNSIYIFSAAILNYLLYPSSIWVLQNSMCIFNAHQ